MHTRSLAFLLSVAVGSLGACGADAAAETSPKKPASSAKPSAKPPVKPSAKPSVKPSVKPLMSSSQAPEQTLRAHFAKQSKDVLEVTAESAESLAPVFWVRFKGGGGGLVLVRGKEVYAERGNATVSAVLKADAFLEKKQITAADFYYLLENLGELPELPADPFTEYKLDELNPKWSFGKDSAQFVLHSPNPKAGSKPSKSGGAPQRDAFPVVRATLNISSTYGLSWKVEDLSYPFAAK